MQLKAGSCGSPDGTANSTIIVPPNYAWLQTNGYCNPAAYGFNPTVCWTFTPTSSSVSINSGFSTNCGNYTFGSFNLYNNSCSLIGTGFNHSGLTPGQTYTFCFTGNTWNTWLQNFFNGPCTGFNDFCPYFFNNSTLPIELMDFDGYARDDVNEVYWITASEINNDYFLLERSEDGIHWSELKRMNGAGNSNAPILYEYTDEKPFIMTTYYRLSQVDFDGVSEVFKTIAVTNENQVFYTYYKEGDINIYLSSPEKFEFYNMMGQVVVSGNGAVVETTGLPQGIYVLRIGAYTQKFFLR